MAVLEKRILLWMTLLCSACGAGATANQDLSATAPYDLGLPQRPDGQAAPPVVSLPPSTTWFWQLSNLEHLDASHPVKVYDLDLYDVDAQAIAGLKQQGKIVLCYINAGAYENWRTDPLSRSIDASDPAVVGKPVDGWNGEAWFNTARPEVRRLAAGRMDLAVQKGCDGIEPDNIDGYDNDTGFQITLQQAIDFDDFLVAQAHARGLAIGLKNSAQLAAAMSSAFDYALVEECFENDECDTYSPFVAAGKAVFAAEYSALDPSQCARAAQLGFQLVYFSRELNGQATWCPMH